MKKEVKFFEVRDSMTFIPVYAVRFEQEGDGSDEEYLLRAGGWGRLGTATYLTTISEARTGYNPHAFGSARTLGRAQAYIEHRWDSLRSGEVIDIEFLENETSEPKESERKIYEQGWKELTKVFGEEIL
jgi:hypothetical protein